MSTCRSILQQARPSQRQVHPMILARRSLREMNGKSIRENELMSLFEAARWAPSYYNTQSWRFVYAKRTSPQWNDYLDALVPANRKWCKDAAVLVVVLSNNNQIYKGKKVPVESHSFDSGAAMMAIALEGTARGLVVHPMTGYDKDKVRNMIGLKDTDEYTIEAMIAIGNRLRRNSEEKTTQRYEINKIISEGTFTEKIT